MFAFPKSGALVTCHIRPLRGGSQPILAEASDGGIYVVKFADNLQGKHLLFNEVMGSRLYRAFGLPVASWKVLRISEKFVDQNPACWLDTPHGRRRRRAGLCFGSSFLAGRGSQILEVLPRSCFDRITNASDFWLAWALDVCAHHSDARQAIFSRQASGHLRATFIDFGHLFGGASGSEPFRHFRASRYLDARIYPSPVPRLLLKIGRLADSLDTDRLWRAARAVPDEWKSQSAVDNFAECLDRITTAGYLQELLAAIISKHQWIEREKLLPGGEGKLERSFLRSGIQSFVRSERSIA